MSNPVVCNRVPGPGNVARLTESVRFSLRDQDSEIDRSSINAYIGYGPVFYTPGDLPENTDPPTFRLGRVLKGSDGKVVRELDGDYLKITKDGDVNDNKDGVYLFGGNDTPTDPDVPVMVECTLKVDEADISPALSPVNDFTGIVFGLFIQDRGFMVRLYSDGTTRWVEMWDASTISTNRPLFPATTYKADYEWDGVEVTYKVLWDPKRDRLALFASTDPESLVGDDILIDGNVSDFTEIPEDQRRADQPLTFFGHGFPGTNSVSRWKLAAYYTDVRPALIDGAFQGENEGFVDDDRVVRYPIVFVPDWEDQPWTLIPETYDAIDGEASVAEGVLTLERTSPTASYGFYRTEPKVGQDTTVVDFICSGTASDQLPGVQVSGFEVFLCDASKEVRVGFTDNLVSKTVGILGTGPEELQGSYVGTGVDWEQAQEYRLLYNTTLGAVLYQKIDDKYVGIGNVPYVDLPPASLPSPAVGFLHNSLAGDVLATFDITKFQYTTVSEFYRAIALPVSPWAKEGAGDTTVDDDTLTIVDDDDISMTRYIAADAGIDFSGVYAAFRMKVDTYSVEDEPEPIRENTGTGVLIDNNTAKLVLAFAENGGSNIAYVAADEDLEDSLLLIRAGVAEGTYIEVDWTEYHDYELEWAASGKVLLWVDGTLSLEIEQGSFNFPATEGTGAKVGFGSMSDLNKNESSWTHFLYSVSAGIDVKARQVLTDDERATRSDYIVNVIVTGDSI